MQILVGVAITLLFFLCLGLAFYSGYCFGNKPKHDLSGQSEEEKRRIKQLQEGWNNILNYDLNVAMKRGG